MHYEHGCVDILTVIRHRCECLQCVQTINHRKFVAQRHLAPVCAMNILSTLNLDHRVSFPQSVMKKITFLIKLSVLIFFCILRRVIYHLENSKKGKNSILCNNIQIL